MWGPLQNPRHVEFYEEFHRGRQSPDQDWMPMVRAVQYLQSLNAASKLYAFTSLWRFHVTTSPSYAECDKHSSVSVIWHFPERRFYLAFGALADGWLNDRKPEQICEESVFAPTVEPFIRRLLASPPSVTERPNG